MLTSVSLYLSQLRPSIHMYNIRHSRCIRGELSTDRSSTADELAMQTVLEPVDHDHHDGYWRSERWFFCLDIDIAIDMSRRRFASRLIRLRPRRTIICTNDGKTRDRVSQDETSWGRETGNGKREQNRGNRTDWLASSSPAVGRAGWLRRTPEVGLPRHWRCWCRDKCRQRSPSRSSSSTYTCHPRWIHSSLLTSPTTPCHCSPPYAFSLTSTPPGFSLALPYAGISTRRCGFTPALRPSLSPDVFRSIPNRSTIFLTLSPSLSSLLASFPLFLSRAKVEPNRGYANDRGVWGVLRAGFRPVRVTGAAIRSF